LTEGFGTPQAGFEVADFDEDASGELSLLHICDKALLEPFLSALRNEPFFSDPLAGGLSLLDLLDGGGLLRVVFFCGGGGSAPLIDEDELIGFLERFWFATFSRPFGRGILESPVGLVSADSVDCDEPTLFTLLVEKLRALSGGEGRSFSSEAMGDMPMSGIFCRVSLDIGDGASSSLTSIASSASSIEIWDPILVPRVLW